MLGTRYAPVGTQFSILGVLKKPWLYQLSGPTNYVCGTGTQIPGSGSTIQNCLGPSPGCQYSWLLKSQHPRRGWSGGNGSLRNHLKPEGLQILGIKSDKFFYPFSTFSPLSTLQWMWSNKCFLHQHIFP